MKVSSENLYICDTFVQKENKQWKKFTAITTIIEQAGNSKQIQL